MPINDIPKKAYIYAQILLDARMNEPRQKIVEDLERSYCLSRGELGDGNYLEVRVLSLLYLLILYPKEIWDLKPNSAELHDLQEVFTLENVKVSWGKRRFPSHDHYEFIHRIRNAVAHARIDFQEDKIFLNDCNGFELQLNATEMSSFLTSVGSFLANISRSS